MREGLPWWLRGKDSTCQCRRHRFHPRTGKVLHAAEQLSPCTATIQPVLQRPGAAPTEPMGCNYWSANALEPMLRSERAAPAHHSEREARTSAETQDSQINPLFKKERKKTAKGFPGEVRPKPWKMDREKVWRGDWQRSGGEGVPAAEEPVTGTAERTARQVWQGPLWLEFRVGWWSGQRRWPHGVWIQPWTWWAATGGLWRKATHPGCFESDHPGNRMWEGVEGQPADEYSSPERLPRPHTTREKPILCNWAAFRPDFFFLSLRSELTWESLLLQHSDVFMQKWLLFLTNIAVFGFSPSSP